MKSYKNQQKDNYMRTAPLALLCNLVSEEPLTPRKDFQYRLKASQYGVRTLVIDDCW